MSVLENQRTETAFTTRDNMLDIWEQVTELSFRGFGKRKRKLPKIPRNFEIWSPESQERWRRSSAEQTAQYEAWDMNFIRNESRIVDDLCRKIVYAIDQANTINPQYLCECDKQRLLQDEAIGLCNNLKRELNHIAATIPCNKNFLAIQTENIEREIALLRAWRKSCNATRANVMVKEITRRKNTAEKFGFIIGKEDIQPVIDELTEKINSVT